MFGRAWLRLAVVASRRWRVELRATCSGTTAIRVIHAESCDNLSPLGNVPAVVVYQAYQRAQTALERVAQPELETVASGA